jgi:RND family efflux transporter MFP subunit
MKRNALIVATAILIVLVIAGIFGWQRVTANAAATNVRTQTATVTRGTLVANVNAAGNVSAPAAAGLAFPSSGRVTKVAVQVGDTVKKDQLLMQLDTADGQLALKAAQANLASAQANYDSAKAKSGTVPDQLVVARASLDKARVTLQQAQAAYSSVAWRPDIGMTAQAAALQTATTDYNLALANYKVAAAGINDTALRTAQASLDSAKVAVDQAQHNLDKSSLYAPFDGIVSAVNYSTGDSAGSGVAVSLVDLSNLQVKVMMAEVDMARVRVGETVMLNLDALTGKMYHGEVTAIGPVGTVMSGVVNYPVIVTISNPDTSIKPGMTANLSVQVDRRVDVLLVPTRAVRTQGNQMIVTVEQNGQSVQVPVGTGLSNDTQVEITNGLQEGDVIVLNQTQTRQANVQMQGQMLIMGGAGIGH